MSTALESLLERLEEGDTGELVGLANDADVHVFIQQGRLAWGHTTPTKGFSFRAFLLERSLLSGPEFDEVVTDGLRRNSSVADVLLKQGLVPRPVLREALARQLRAAVESLAGAERALFVRRAGWLAKYDVSLTFSWAELKAATIDADASAPSLRDDASRPPAAHDSLPGLMRELPGLTWAVTVAHGQVREATPASARAPKWGTYALGRGTSMALLRRGEEMTLGVRTRLGELWAGGSSSTVGLAAALAAFRARAELRTLRTTNPDEATHWIGTHGCDPALLQLLSNEPLVYGAAVVTPDGHVSARAKGQRLVRQLQRLLPANHELLLAEAGPLCDNAVRLSLVQDSGLWCGCLAGRRPQHTVCIVAAEELGLGMAHALLGAFSFRLPQTPAAPPQRTSLPSLAGLRKMR